MADLATIDNNALEPPKSLDDLRKRCEVCRAIWTCVGDWSTRLRPGPKLHQLVLGHTDKPLSCDCPGHSPLFFHYLGLSENNRLDEFDSSLSDRGDDESSTEPSDGAEPNAEVAQVHHERRVSQVVIGRLSNMSYLTRLNSVGVGTFSQPVLLLKKHIVPDHPGTGLELDPSWVDLQLALQWNENCLNQHGTECNNPRQVSPVRPFWVMDVERACIVPGQDCDAFVALSYRWGDHSWPEVDKKMLRELQKPRALVTARMAPIVRHAMGLTLALGERYLWVDALCVVKDNNAETVHQLNLMGAFYASAVLTIVAADGDSMTGIPGLRGISGPRIAGQALIPFGEERLITPQAHIRLGEYAQRGWTYQEYVMAQRRLTFSGNRMHWVCRRCEWHEEIVCNSAESQAPHIQGRHDRNLVFRGLPDMMALQSFISDYNWRSFTYEEDALPGISGLLSLASRSFQGGFLCGLPEMFFDRALGWVASGDPSFRRRVKSGRSEEQRLSHSIGKLPSWSWIGWEGDIATPLEPEEAIEIRTHWGYWLTEETTSITDWYTSDSAKGTALRKINSHWFVERDTQYKDFTRPLPEGWTRQRVTDADVPYPGLRWRPPGCDEYLFRHQLCSERLWYYPFPITGVKESMPQVMPEQTPYLFCKTHKARLWAKCNVDLWEELERKSNRYTGSCGVLYEKTLQVLEIRTDCHGPAVGELYLHSIDQLIPFLVASGDHIKSGSGEPVEVVAIYSSLVHESLYNGPAVTQERYRVLWVGWEDGIAHRLGVGWVERAAWEGSNPAEIDLVLG